VGALALSSTEVEHIQSVSNIVGDTKNYEHSQIASFEFDTLKRVLNSWPFEKQFPVLDLLRLVVIHPHGSYHFSQSSEIPVFERLLKHVSSSPASCDNSKLVTLRVLANLFHGAKEIALKLSGGVANVLLQLKPLACADKKPNQVALSYLLLNYAIGLQHQTDSTADAGALLNFLEEVLVVKQDEESLYRIILALGTLRQKFSVEIKSAISLIQNNQPLLPDNVRSKEALNELIDTTL